MSKDVVIYQSTDRRVKTEALVDASSEIVVKRLNDLPVIDTKVNKKSSID